MTGLMTEGSCFSLFEVTSEPSVVFHKYTMMGHLHQEQSRTNQVCNKRLSRTCLREVNSNGNVVVPGWLESSPRVRRGVS